MPPVTVRLWESGNTVYARMTIALQGGGSLGILVSLTHQQVIEAMRKAGIRFSPSEQAQIGSLFGNIGKFVKKVARSSVLKGVLKVGGSLLNSGLVKMMIPGAAQALEAASGAMKMIKAAQGKGPQAAKAKLALKAANAQADLETKNGGAPMPVPTGVAAKGPEAAMAYRWLVTAERVKAA